MMTADEQQSFDSATEDAREFLRRAKQLLTEEDVFPGDIGTNYDVLVVDVAKLIASQYQHRDINATLEVYIGHALDEIRDALELEKSDAR